MACVGAAWKATWEGGGGADSLGNFYRVVVQSVLFFGAEIWVLTETMIQRLEVAHMIFLKQVTRKQETRRRDGSWRQVTSEAVIQVTGTQMLREYMYRRQATVAEWVAPRPIFYLCAIETGYEGGGGLRVPWWRQKAEEDQLRVVVEDILAASRVQRQQESGRRDRSEGGLEEGSTDSEEYCRGGMHWYNGTETVDAQVVR